MAAADPASQKAPGTSATGNLATFNGRAASGWRSRARGHRMRAGGRRRQSWPGTSCAPARPYSAKARRYGFAKRGGLTEANVTVTSRPRVLRDATFVVEAIVEDREPRRSSGRPLDGHAAARRRARHDHVLAVGRASSPRPAVARTASSACTSSTRSPKMELVELAFPRAAADATRERARALCARSARPPVEVPDTPGFVVNRLLFPYLFDAVRLHGGDRAGRRGDRHLHAPRRRPPDGPARAAGLRRARRLCRHRGRSASRCRRASRS